MTILKRGLEKEKILFFYKKLKEIQEKIKEKTPTCQQASMGMSSDYKEAIKAGATEVRLGTALFGKRE